MKCAAIAIACVIGAAADGRIGGARDFQTYILLSNPNPVDAEVEVRFLKASQVEIRNYTLPPTSRWNINAAADVPQFGPGVFSADVRVLNFQPIAVEKAMYWNDSDGRVWAGGTGVTATLFPPRQARCAFRPPFTQNPEQVDE